MPLSKIRKTLRELAKKWIHAIFLKIYSQRFRKYNFADKKKVRKKIFDHTGLWSSPASGNTWVRFIIEYLTGCPSLGVQFKDPGDIPLSLQVVNRLTPSVLAHVDMDKPFIVYKSHHPYSIEKSSSIILLIRNFYELLKGDKFADNRITVYLELIVSYDHFKGKKMLIYYEDLLTNPKTEIYKLKCFFNSPEKHYKSFINNYEYYQKISKRIRGSISGNDSDFYNKQPMISPAEVEIRKKNFHLLLNEPKYQYAKPYLARYMEKT